jgi:ABC-type polysaccharide/polyol phosphate transport system ATPase subunit
MYMRLGFSVATAIQPDILLLDEVLAVGDAEFSERCIERLRSFQNAGCTIVLATHDLATAGSLATQAIWLDRGGVRMQGVAEEVIACYRASFQS